MLRKKNLNKSDKSICLSDTLEVFPDENNACVTMK